jgi:hypothetical protein
VPRRRSNLNFEPERVGEVNVRWKRKKEPTKPVYLSHVDRIMDAEKEE